MDMELDGLESSLSLEEFYSNISIEATSKNLRNLSFDVRQCGQFTKFYEQVYGDFQYYCEGVLFAGIGGVGLAANIASIAVLTSKQMRKEPFNILLAILAFYDIMYIFFNIPVHANFIWPSISYIFSQFLLLAKLYVYVLYPMSAVSFCGSVYLTLAVTAERYIAVCHPFKYRTTTQTRSKAWRVLIYVIPVTMFSLALNIPKFIEITLDDANGTYIISLSNTRMDTTYIYWYVISTLLHPTFTTGILPMIGFVYMNVNIFIGIYFKRPQIQGQNQNTTNNNLAITLCVIVLKHLLCNVLRVFLGILLVLLVDVQVTCMDHIHTYIPPLEIMVLESVAHLLVMVNVSSNFLVYCAVSREFKATLRSMLTSYKRHPPGPSSSTATNIINGCRASTTVSNINLSSSVNHSPNIEKYINPNCQPKSDNFLSPDYQPSSDQHPNPDNFLSPDYNPNSFHHLNYDQISRTDKALNADHHISSDQSLIIDHHLKIDRRHSMQPCLTTDHQSCTNGHLNNDRRHSLVHHLSPECHHRMDPCLNYERLRLNTDQHLNKDHSPSSDCHLIPDPHLSIEHSLSSDHNLSPESHLRVESQLNLDQRLNIGHHLSIDNHLNPDQNSSPTHNPNLDKHPTTFKSSVCPSSHSSRRKSFNLSQPQNFFSNLSAAAHRRASCMASISPPISEEEVVSPSDDTSPLITISEFNTTAQFLNQNGANPRKGSLIKKSDILLLVPNLNVISPAKDWKRGPKLSMFSEGIWV